MLFRFSTLTRRASGTVCSSISNLLAASPNPPCSSFSSVATTKSSLAMVGSRLVSPLLPSNGSRAFFSSSESSSSNNSDSNSDKEKDNVSEAKPILKTPEQEQIEKLIADNKSLKDQLLRALAEEENVRRIARKDVDNAKQFALTSFAKSLLEIADNLEMAIDTFPKDKRNPEDKSLLTLLEGVEMTNKNFQKVFSKFNIIKYGVIGEKFDPALHNALFNIPNADKDADTLGQVLKTGYKLNDRVIRAADVGTFQKP